MSGAVREVCWLYVKWARVFQEIRQLAACISTPASLSWLDVSFKHKMSHEWFENLLSSQKCVEYEMKE